MYKKYIKIEIILAIFCFAIALNLSPGASFSLSRQCNIPSAEEALSKSPLVFIGKVVSIKEQSEKNLKFWQKPVVIGYRVKFAISQILKGKQQKTITVFINHKDQYWDNVFIKGKEYLVYAYQDEKGTLNVSNCHGRVLRLDSEAAKEDIKYLNNKYITNQSSGL